MSFQQGDTVRNINPASKYYDMVGTYHRELKWTFQSTGDVLEPACDVEYPGQYGPYRYPYIAQRESDLVRETNEARWLQAVSHLTIQELADRVGVSRQAYHKWLRGETITAEHKAQLKELIATYQQSLTDGQVL